MIETKALSNSGVGSLIPDFVRDNYETFSAFIGAYFDWLDNEQGLSNIRIARDVDETIDRFVEFFKREYLASFPDALAVNPTTGPASKRKLMKNIRKFYRAKGTEASFELLFRILYDSSVEFYYPKVDILRASDGKWIRETSIRATQSNGTRFYDAVNRIVTQRESSSGEKIASARVERVELYRIESNEIAELFLTDIDGVFVPDEPIEFTTEAGVFIREPSVYRVLSGISVASGGSGYAVGDIVTVSAGSGDSGTDTVAVVDRVSSTGAIQRVQIRQFGVRYNGTTTPTFGVETDAGSGATFTVSYAGTVNYPGFYANNDGHVSSNKRLQDNRYYQTYSYVLRSETTIERYRENVKKLLHPAGFAFFGQILIKKCKKAQLQQLCRTLALETPYIGNYLPYSLNTIDNLSVWFQTQGIPQGYDPNIHDSILNEANQNPITNDEPFVLPAIPVSTPGFILGDPYWVVYPHPNTRVANGEVYEANIPFDQKDDFYDQTDTGSFWPEWVVTDESERNHWYTDFTQSDEYRNVRLIYLPTSPFRKITIGAFLRMPSGN